MRSRSLATKFHDPRQSTLRASCGHYGFHFLFASDFATSRAQSMKCCTTGLGVRFVRVTFPIGTLAIGSSTGKILSSGCSVGNLNTELATIVRNRPVANWLISTAAGTLYTVPRG